MSRTITPFELGEDIVRSFGVYSPQYEAHLALSEKNKTLTEALQEVKDWMEGVDAPWWIDCPNKGGFDMDIIDKALNTNH